MITLAGRDTTYAERDLALTAKDVAAVERDALRSFVDDFADQAWVVVECQDGIFRTTLELLRRIDAVKQELRAATLTAETTGYLELLARLTSDL